MGALNSSTYTSTQQQDIISPQQLSRILKAPKNCIYSSRITQSQIKQCIRKIIPFAQSSQNVTNYLSMFQQIGKSVQSQNLYLPFMCQIKGQQNVCNDFRKLELYYENYDVKITEEISARKKQKESFAEEEIWYILYSILNACRRFERYSISSGNLKTNHILLNQKGHVKVINRLTSPPSETQKTQRQTLPTFYSPQQLRIKRQNVDKVLNPNICQTYSIGIIILQICTFISGQKLYDMDNIRINDYALRKTQQIAMNKTMLSNSYDRPLPSQIYTAFKPYQKKILSLKPFKFDPNVLKQTLPMSTVSF